MKSENKTPLHLLSFILNALVMVLIAFVIAQAAASAYDIGYRVFTEPAMEKSPGRDVTVEVKKAMPAKELGTILEEKGLVDNAWLFVIQLKVSAYADKINAGIYTLNTSMTAREMMEVMAKKETEETEK